MSPDPLDTYSKPCERHGRMHWDVSQAQEFIAAFPVNMEAQDAREFIAAAAAESQERGDPEWRGAAGRTNVKVFSAACALLAADGRIHGLATSRAVGLEAGCDAKTASAALVRIAAAGWLSLLEITRRGDGRRVIVRVPGSVLQSSPSSLVSGYSDGEVSAHETWIRLGDAARAVYGSLTENPRGGTEIAAAARVARSTAWRQLPRLEAAGLALRAGGGRWVRGQATADATASAAGWEPRGITVARQRRWASEPEAQRLWLREHRRRYTGRSENIGRTLVGPEKFDEVLRQPDGDAAVPGGSDSHGRRGPAGDEGY